MTNLDKAIKPCPFCGSEAELEHGSDHHGQWFNLGCSRHWGNVDPDRACVGGRLWYTETEKSEAEAIAAWNTRQALSDLSSNKLEPGDVEKVARIIDPEAFSAEPDVFATEMYGSASPSRVSMAAAILARRRDEALHKAEDILSALGHGAT
jgi:hypothetical protein